ncbi:MAG TPA: hypothetical protein VH062_34365 [Polyangiaceae bacterium]|jgi:hypothetical protein|nr:hypothetical protein [Polyangiaceae bacterium]
MLPLHVQALPLAALVAFTLVGCGGSKPPADTAPPAAVSPAASAAPATAPTTSAATETASATTAPAEAPPAPEPTTPIADRIFAPSVAFMIRYDDSAPKQAARTACTKFDEDPDAHGKCVDKERSRFLADVLVFKQSDKGTKQSEQTTSLIIYRRDGNSLSEISRSALEVGDKTPERVALKVKSDKGTRVLFAGKKELAVTASPDSSSMIVIDDPRFGKLVYEARIGLVNDPIERSVESSDPAITIRCPLSLTAALPLPRTRASSIIRFDERADFERGVRSLHVHTRHERTFSCCLYRERPCARSDTHRVQRR